MAGPFMRTFERVDPLATRVKQPPFSSKLNLCLLPLFVLSCLAYAAIQAHGYILEPWSFRGESRNVNSVDSSAYSPKLSSATKQSIANFQMSFWLLVPGQEKLISDLAEMPRAAVVTGWAEDRSKAQVTCQSKTLPALRTGSLKRSSFASNAQTATLRNEAAPLGTLEDADEVLKLSNWGDEGFIWLRWPQVSYPDLDSLHSHVSSFSTRLMFQAGVFKPDEFTTNPPWKIYPSPGSVSATYLQIQVVVDERGDIVKDEGLGTEKLKLQNTRYEIQRSLPRSPYGGRGGYSSGRRQLAGQGRKNHKVRGASSSSSLPPDPPATGANNGGATMPESRSLGCENLTTFELETDGGRSICDFVIGGAAIGGNERPDLLQLGCVLDSFVLFRFEETMNVVVRSDRIFDVLGQIGGGFGLLFTIFQVLSAVLQGIASRIAARKSGGRHEQSKPYEDGDEGRGGVELSTNPTYKPAPQEPSSQRRRGYTPEQV